MSKAFEEWWKEYSKDKEGLYMNTAEETCEEAFEAGARSVVAKANEDRTQTIINTLAFLGNMSNKHE